MSDPKQLELDLQNTGDIDMTVAGAVDDMIVLDSSDISSLTIGNLDSYILSTDSIDFNNMSYSGVYTTGNTTVPYGSSYTINPTNNVNYGSVEIGSNGMNMKEDCDVKIGNRSLKDFMDKVEERLAILRPNEGLEERWEKLKRLGNRYRKLEKEILEKEKIMEALKQ